MTEIPSIYTFPISCPKCTEGTICMVVEIVKDGWVLRFECQKCGHVAKTTVAEWISPKEPPVKEVKKTRVTLDTIRDVAFYDKVISTCGYDREPKVRGKFK